MMTVRCHLAPSAIEGLGVFLGEDVKAGDVVWAHDPRFDLTFDRAELDRVPAPVRLFLERYTYAHPDTPGRLILDGDEGRFMNHADAPNVDLSEVWRGIALVDMAAGTELTCDYSQFDAGALDFQPPRHRVVPAAQAAE